MGSKEPKGYLFSKKKKRKVLGFFWNCLKSGFITRLEGFEWSLNREKVLVKIIVFEIFLLACRSVL